MNTIHPSAIIGKHVELGDGNQIGPGCVIEDGVVLGSRNKLWHNVYVGPGTTLGDIARSDPSGDMLRREVKEEVDRVIRELEALAARSRSQSLSMLVPMGGEMAYRYQENLVHETLAVLRAFRARWEERAGGG